jgi:hypothetical protein
MNPPGGSQNPLAALPEPIYFAVSKWRILRFPKSLGFGIRNPQLPQPTIGGIHGDKREFVRRDKTRCPAIPRRGLEFPIGDASIGCTRGSFSLERSL